jgi:hypothetical protein
MKIHEIPGFLLVEWSEQGKAVIDTWSSCSIKVAEFREAILIKALAYAKAHQARAWVVDSSKAKGAYPQDVQDLIASEVFKAFAGIGIKFFISIKPASAVTTMSLNRVISQLGPAGIQMVEVPDVETALAWLKEHP